MEWLHELLLESKAQLGLRGWGAAVCWWCDPALVPPAMSPCSWYRSHLIAAGEPTQGHGSPLWQQCSGVMGWELGKMGKSNTCTVLWP